MQLVPPSSSSSLSWTTRFVHLLLYLHVLNTVQIYFRNQLPAPDAEPFIPGNLPLATVLSLVVDSFTSATERQIEVGDGLELYVVMNRERNVDDLLGDGMLGAGMEVVELGTMGQGDVERTFLVTRSLKRD